jgi:predicted porin
MKKFVVLLVVVALTCFSAVAFAADVTVSGSIDIRSRDFSVLNLNKDVPAASGTDQRDTQERIRINVDAKAGNDVKGRISIENNWDTWGRVEFPQGNGQNTTTDRGIQGITYPSSDPVRPEIREAWISFNLPGIPVNVTGGHQLLQLGNGWWFRSMKYGSDAWVVANVTGNNTLAFVDVKAAGDGPIGSTARADDVDAYVLLDVYKISDNHTVGIDFTDVHDRLGALGAPGSDLQNLSLTYNGKLGPVALKAQLDQQMGKVKSTPEAKFKGNEIVIEGKVPMDPVTINFTVARGSGSKPTDTDIKSYVNILDADQHYTLLYEYKIPAAGGIHTGFSNTTAVNVGAMFAASPSLGVGADFWWLQATEDVLNGAGVLESDLGMELDVKVNWKLYDNLTWNWQLGYFMPGDAYKISATKDADAATGIQGVLSFKF